MTAYEELLTENRQLAEEEGGGGNVHQVTWTTRKQANQATQLQVYRFPEDFPRGMFSLAVQDVTG